MCNVFSCCMCCLLIAILVLFMHLLCRGQITLFDPSHDKYKFLWYYLYSLPYNLSKIILVNVISRKVQQHFTASLSLTFYKISLQRNIIIFRQANLLSPVEKSYWSFTMLNPLMHIMLHVKHGVDLYYKSSGVQQMKCTHSLQLQHVHVVRLPKITMMNGWQILFMLNCRKALSPVRILCTILKCSVRKSFFGWLFTTNASQSKM